MKAAMQAAMELEGRLEALEGRVEAFEARFADHQDIAASKAELQALEERDAVARRDLMAVVAEKADLEQLGQCLQAVRHELGEVVKRKANSELVESNLQALRMELMQSLAEQGASLAELQAKAEVQHAEVVAELNTKAAQRGLEQQITTLQGLADDAARRVDIARLEQYIQTQVPAWLQSKADAEAVFRLEGAQAKLQDDLQARVTTSDFEALENVVARKADHNNLLEGLQDLRQEVLVSLKCKANTDFLEQQIQQAQTLCLQESHKLSQSLQAKADQTYVEKHVQDSLATLVERSQESESKIEELTRAKADKDKVVEIVEAVRDEVMSGLQKRPDFEEQFMSTLTELAEQLKDKADEVAVDKKFQRMREDIKGMATDKADTEYVSERVEVVQQNITAHVVQNLQVVREELTLLIGHKVDMDLMDRRFEAFEEAVMQAMKVHYVRKTSTKSKNWKEETVYEECGSEGTTHEGWTDTRSDAATMSDMEEWMDHRMKLVKLELTKLVQYKADVDQVNDSMQAVRREVTQHCDHRVEAAEQTLVHHIQRQAQHIRKEFKADVGLLTECMSQVERTFENMQGETDLPSPIRAFQEILHGKMLSKGTDLSGEDVLLPYKVSSVDLCNSKVQKTGHPTQADRHKPDAAESDGFSARRKSQQEWMPKRLALRDDDFSPDDIRTRRVRDLLHKLVVPETQQ